MQTTLSTRQMKIGVLVSALCAMFFIAPSSISDAHTSVDEAPCQTNLAAAHALNASDRYDRALTRAYDAVAMATEENAVLREELAFLKERWESRLNEQAPHYDRAEDSTDTASRFQLDRSISGQILPLASPGPDHSR